MARNAKRQANTKANNDIKNVKKEPALSDQVGAGTQEPVLDQAEAGVKSAIDPASNDQTDAGAINSKDSARSDQVSGNKESMPQADMPQQTSKKPQADTPQKTAKKSQADTSQKASKKSQTGASQKASKKPPREVLYQVKTKRDSAVIKAYITFTYRVMHPGVTGRLIFFGILIALPAIIAKQMWLKAACIIVGALLILLGFFRQYISLALTKRNDEAYKNGTEFTYDFTLNDAKFYSDDKVTSSISKYKDIISFFYDDDFYYLGIRSRDFFILPKSRFTKGDPAEFEDFIYKRCKKTCKWIPNKFSDRMKLRRAARALKAESSQK